MFKESRSRHNVVWWNGKEEEGKSKKVETTKIGDFFFLDDGDGDGDSGDCVARNY